MADSRTLKVSSAISQLTLEETRDLVFQMGVALQDVDNITERYSGDMQKVHLVKMWLDMMPDTSWDKLVTGLRKINKNSLATEIEFQYCQRVPVPSSGSLPLLSTPSISVSPAPCHLETATPVFLGCFTPAPLTQTPVSVGALNLGAMTGTSAAVGSLTAAPLTPTQAPPLTPGALTATQSPVSPLTPGALTATPAVFGSLTPAPLAPTPAPVGPLTFCALTATPSPVSPLTPGALTATPSPVSPLTPGALTPTPAPIGPLTLCALTATPAAVGSLTAAPLTATPALPLTPGALTTISAPVGPLTPAALTTISAPVGPLIPGALTATPASVSSLTPGALTTTLAAVGPFPSAPLTATLAAVGPPASASLAGAPASVNPLTSAGLTATPPPVGPLISAPLTAIPAPVGSLSLPNESSTIFHQKVENTREAIEHFEEEFSDIKHEAQESLSLKQSEDQSFIRKFRNHLLDMSVSKKQVHIQFFSRNEDEILKTETIEKLFVILGRYCNYSNYEIIFHIVKRFCPALKGKMLKYRDSLTNFEKSTTVDVYLYAISARPGGKLWEGFLCMTMKVNKSPSECMLYEIRELKESIEEDASLESYAMYIETPGEGSVCVRLLIPWQVHSLVARVLTPEFREKYLLTEVMIKRWDIEKDYLVIN